VNDDLESSAITLKAINQKRWERYSSNQNVREKEKKKWH